LSKSLGILLVEDERLILDVAQDMLEESGYLVRTASCGLDAIDIMSRPSLGFSALVTDVRLGAGPDGWELARHARRLRSDIAVIYMTGDSAADWPVQGVPGSLVLQKPFAMADIVTALDTLLNRIEMKAPTGLKVRPPAMHSAAPDNP